MKKITTWGFKEFLVADELDTAGDLEISIDESNGPWVSVYINEQEIRNLIEHLQALID